MAMVCSPNTEAQNHKADWPLQFCRWKLWVHLLVAFPFHQSCSHRMLKWSGSAPTATVSAQPFTIDQPINQLINLHSLSLGLTGEVDWQSLQTWISFLLHGVWAGALQKQVTYAKHCSVTGIRPTCMLAKFWFGELCKTSLVGHLGTPCTLAP